MKNKPKKVQIDSLSEIKNSPEWIDFLIEHFLLYIGDDGTVLRKEDIDLPKTRSILIDDGIRIESSEGGYYKIEPEDYLILLLEPDFIQEYGYGPLYLGELNEWFIKNLLPE